VAVPVPHRSAEPSRRTDAPLISTQVGAMRAGACTLYDGRLLHAGQPNSRGTRVLFYVSFKAPGADGGLGNEAAHSIDADLFGRGLTLGDLVG
jgi:hypothetical protein